MTEAIYLAKNGPISEIILNQPSKRNAINSDMWSGLGDCVDQAVNDPDTVLIVVTGAGDHFAAGADITEFETVYKTKETAFAYTRAMLDSLKTLEQAPKPTVAKIKGVCVGGGCSIALACDLRFAANSSSFCIPPSRLGLAYSLDDTRRLVRAVGRDDAMTLLTTARTIDAMHAKEIGFVTEVVDAAGLDRLTQSLAEDLTEVSSWSIKATKKVFQLLEDGVTDDDPRASDLLDEAFTGDHFQEGFRAFLEKRKPKFPAS